MSVERRVRSALGEDVRRLDGRQSGYERHGDKILKLECILEESLGQCEGRLACALEVLDCDHDEDNVDKDEDNVENDWVAFGPIIGAAGAMGDIR